MYTYAESHAEHWTQEYDQEERYMYMPIIIGYTKITHALLC